MTYEEAIGALKQINLTRVHPFYDWEEMKDVRDMAIFALEKDVPKHIEEQTEEDREFVDYVCPNCKTTLQQKMKGAKRITIHKYKHCIDCGQALDWSEESEVKE